MPLLRYQPIIVKIVCGYNLGQDEMGKKTPLKIIDESARNVTPMIVMLNLEKLRC